MPVLAKTKVGKYFRTTVPREVRKILEIKENDTVEWVLEKDRIIVRRGKENVDKTYREVQRA
ncbi:MAG: AbrB/MazE/SpoVT family DNA-binding domain-containing protein [Desulfurococcales archaeon]|nr:AbrB/MazE/SpoVT family DNA-binding domain-containing protein [Desulfurococcales archaeon]